MNYVSRKTNEWYTENFYSHKVSLFLLVYYFCFYIYLAPNLSYQVLSLFLDKNTAFLYAQLMSDLICMFPILYLLKPLLIDSWHHFVEYPSFVLWKGISLYIPQLLANGIVQSIVIVITGASSGANQETAMLLFKASPIVIAFPAILIAPFIEEGIFRGVIFKSLRKYGFWTAALVSGFSFGLLHCVGDLLSGNWNGLFFILIYATMGIFMSKAYEDSKNLFGSIFLHMFMNIIAVLAMTFVG